MLGGFTDSVAPASLGPPIGGFLSFEQEWEVASPIIVVTKGKPSAGVQKLIDFIKGDGKKFVK